VTSTNGKQGDADTVLVTIENRRELLYAGEQI
jgi:hypothetical protein